MLSDAAFASALTSSFRASFILPQLTPSPAQTNPQAERRLAADKQLQQDGVNNASAQRQKDIRSRLDAQARIANQIVSRALSAQVSAVSNFAPESKAPSSISQLQSETLVTAQVHVQSAQANRKTEVPLPAIGNASDHIPIRRLRLEIKPPTVAIVQLPSEPRPLSVAVLRKSVVFVAPQAAVVRSYQLEHVASARSSGKILAAAISVNAFG
ncbi:MAG: hypothetical protein Q9M26_05725 [Mariprofundales bacterium]|nr:hypothetical protein [Mariprofundales bacterium]